MQNEESIEATHMEASALSVSLLLKEYEEMVNGSVYDLEKYSQYLYM